MGQIRTQTGWERQIGGLTVEPDPMLASGGRAVEGLDHLIVSQRLVARLAAAARALVASELCDHLVWEAPRGPLACPLAARLGSHEACELAHELAELAPPAVTATPDPVKAYTGALREAAHAVYYCRRVAHPGGQCWFSPGDPGLQRCRRVLAAAHRSG